jgi:hypothetical protein
LLASSVFKKKADRILAGGTSLIIDRPDALTFVSEYRMLSQFRATYPVK